MKTVCRLWPRGGSWGRTLTQDPLNLRLRQIKHVKTSAERSRWSEGVWTFIFLLFIDLLSECWGSAHTVVFLFYIFPCAFNNLTTSSHFLLFFFNLSCLKRFSSFSRCVPWILAFVTFVLLNMFTNIFSSEMQQELFNSFRNFVQPLAPFLSFYVTFGFEINFSYF